FGMTAALETRSALVRSCYLRRQSGNVTAPDILSTNRRVLKAKNEPGRRGPPLGAEFSSRSSLRVSGAALVLGLALGRVRAVFGLRARERMSVRGCGLARRRE